ncbi:MAG: hypothetical protein ACYDDU_19630, partial [Dermatophilaceae bacterium]
VPVPVPVPPAVLTPAPKNTRWSNYQTYWFPQQPPSRLAVAGRTFDTLWYIAAVILILVALGGSNSAADASDHQPTTTATTAPAFSPLTNMSVTGTGGNLTGGLAGGTSTGGTGATSKKIG